MRLNYLDYKRFYNQKTEQFTRFDNGGKLAMNLRIYPREVKVAELALQGELSDAWALQKMKGHELYFSLELECPATGMTEFLNLDSEQTTFSERVEYYHFRFLSDIKVEFDNKPISLAQFEFERLFNISPKGKFFGVIPINKKAKKLKISIADRIYDHDTATFEFDLHSIRKLPKLKKIKKPGKK
jgi:hypothetical protein